MMQSLIFSMLRAAEELQRTVKTLSLYQHAIYPSSGYDGVQSTYNYMKFYKKKMQVEFLKMLPHKMIHNF